MQCKLKWTNLQEEWCSPFYFSSIWHIIMQVCVNLIFIRISAVLDDSMPFCCEYLPQFYHIFKIHILRLLKKHVPHFWFFFPPSTHEAINRPENSYQWHFQASLCIAIEEWKAKDNESNKTTESVTLCNVCLWLVPYKIVCWWVLWRVWNVCRSLSLAKTNGEGRTWFTASPFPSPSVLYYLNS